MKRLFLFVIFFVLVHFIVREIRYRVSFEMDQYWPISIFMPKMPVWQDILTTAALLLEAILFVKEWLNRKRVLVLFVIVLFMTATTNLLQGYHTGFIEPTTGKSIYDVMYWQDAVRISDPLNFLNSFHLLQPTLSVHGQTHPPGAALLYYGLKNLFYFPVMVSLILMLSGLAGGLILIHLLSSEVKKEVALLTGFLFMLFPAVNIYSLATLDSLIATAFLGTFALWQKNHTKTGLIWSVVAFWFSSFITFTSVFLIPVLIFDDWRRHGRIHKSLLLFIGVALIYGVLFFTTGFSYPQGFIQASWQESAGTWYFIREPASYLVTRLENVLEIILFFGPFLTPLLYKALKTLRPWRRLDSLPATGMIAAATLLGFYTTGAYYTGETARNSLYIYPFLFVILAYLLEKLKLNQTQELKLLGLVLAQSYLMQLFGWYAW